MAEAGPAGVLQVMCNRGCGVPIEVDTQMVTNMVALDQPLVFAHAEGQCPTELAEAAEPDRPTRRFHVSILGYEILDGADVEETAWFRHVDIPGAELLGGLGHDVSAKTFAAAVNGPMTTWLASRSLADGREMISAWEKFQRQAAWADTPAPAAVVDAPEEPARRTGPGGAVLLG